MTATSVESLVEQGDRIESIQGVQYRETLIEDYRRMHREALYQVSLGRHAYTTYGATVRPHDAQKALIRANPWGGRGNQRDIWASNRWQVYGFLKTAREWRMELAVLKGQSWAIR